MTLSKWRVISLYTDWLKNRHDNKIKKVFIYRKMIILSKALVATKTLMCFYLNVNKGGVTTLFY